MSVLEEPFEMLVAGVDVQPAGGRVEPPAVAAGAGTTIITARLQGFSLDEQPLVVDLPTLGAEVVAARTTVPLSQADVGATIVVLLEGGNVRRPIVLGAVRAQSAVNPAAPGRADAVVVTADDQRMVLSAEREIVLRCGDASITLTRAGKVIIKGNYIVSRSSGYNKIKGAAIDIN